MPDPTELHDRQTRHPLRHYRDRHNLRLADLAARAGMSAAGLSRIEAGATELPGCNVILALASATEHEVGEIDIFRWHFHAATGQQAVGGTIGYQPQRGPSVAAAPPATLPVKEAASF
jgi:transcriptional regulator with XRE-family HTH domain